MATRAAGRTPRPVRCLGADPKPPIRLAVYTDYVYRRDGAGVYAPRAFATFMAGLAGAFDRLVLVGRLDPRPGRAHYRLPPGVELVGLPYYPSGAHPAGVARALVASMRRFSRVLDEVDAAWVLGPQGLAIPFALLTLARRRRLVLGVRQELARYVRTRHPGRPGLAAAAWLLEAAFRGLARRAPVVVVGPALARDYRHACRVLPIAVSLVGESDMAGEHATPDWRASELRVLSVGRLDSEKNPLLLADVLRVLRARDPRWRLVVCGEGPLREALARRLAECGVAEAADLRGYVALDDGLLDVYRDCHALLHVSLTEGVPQVLYEAFATRVPVVATAVGGVGDAVGDAALLVEPGDAEAAADRLARLSTDPQLRARLVAAGDARVRTHTREAELGRLAAFLGGDPALLRDDGRALAPP